MPAAVGLREDFSADVLRRLAAETSDARQARRLLALAAVRDGMSRTAAARIGGMDRQTLRDWVHAFNARGPSGLINGKAPGRVPKLTAEQIAWLVALVERGPDPEVDGVVRWRCVDLKGLIKTRFAVDLDEVSIARLLKAARFSHISTRPQHPKQDVDQLEAFKKTSSHAWRRP